MDIDHALIALSALSQETRLRIFHLLVPYGKDGLPAGMIGRELNIPHNTLSFHLSHLHSADLVTSRRQSRSIIYAANVDKAAELTAFMMQNCCAKETEERSDCAPRKENRQSLKNQKLGCC